MTRSAQGTVEESGRNVAQKAGLTAKSPALHSDFEKIDRHEIAPEEYDELPELTDADLDRATFRIDGKEVSREEFAAAANAQLSK
jgi:hypothetical protein